MQIVIDIPEQMYLNAKAGMLCGSDSLVNAIKNGTPLPKGHGRLIDGDVFVKVIKELRSEWNARGTDYECGRYRSFDSVLYAFDNNNLTIIEADMEDNNERLD